MLYNIGDELGKGGRGMRDEKRKPQRKMNIDELLAKLQYCKNKIEAGNNVVRNQFKALNLAKRVRIKRGGRRKPI